MKKLVLFDLDATLLPLDQDKFIRDYLISLTAWMAPHGYEPKAFAKAVWLSCEAVMTNDGSRLNETAFWQVFTGLYGEKAQNDMPLFNEYYENEFQKLKACCGFQPLASELIKRLKQAGIRVAVATNPVFPSAATEERLRWAGLEPSDFELVTTYENCSYCKPNYKYYLEIAEKLKISPEECLMVGNDTDDDASALEAGMDFFLVTDCLINRKNKDISKFNHGTFEELFKYLEVQ